MAELCDRVRNHNVRGGNEAVGERFLIGERMQLYKRGVGFVCSEKFGEQESQKGVFLRVILFTKRNLKVQGFPVNS